MRGKDRGRAFRLDRKATSFLSLKVVAYENVAESRGRKS